MLECWISSTAFWVNMESNSDSKMLNLLIMTKTQQCMGGWSRSNTHRYVPLHEIRIYHCCLSLVSSNCPWQEILQCVSCQGSLVTFCSQTFCSNFFRTRVSRECSSKAGNTLPIGGHTTYVVPSRTAELVSASLLCNSLQLVLPSFPVSCFHHG